MMSSCIMEDTHEDELDEIELELEVIDEDEEPDEWPKDEDAVHVHELLTAEEERYHIQRAQEGDEESRNKIILCNQRLIYYVVFRYLKGKNGNKCIETRDLISEGNLGLIKAINKFDLSLGYRFTTYAMCWIKQSIRICYLETQTNFRIPIKVFETIAYLENKDNKTDEDVIKLKELINVTRHPSSNQYKSYDRYLLHPFNSHDDGSCKPLENGVLTIELKSILKKYINKLLPREQTIMRFRFGMEKGTKGESSTLTAIANILNLTRERIRQIEIECIRKLRMYFSNDNLLKEDFI